MSHNIPDLPTSRGVPREVDRSTPRPGPGQADPIEPPAQSGSPAIGPIGGALDRVLDRTLAAYEAILDRRAPAARAEGHHRPTPPPPAATRTMPTNQVPKTRGTSKPRKRTETYRIPGETMSAIFAAGLTDGEHFVLSEGFKQLYGRARAETLRLVPSEIGRRTGILATNVSKSIRSLVRRGILLKRDKNAYTFVERWKSWDWTGRSARRLAYVAWPGPDEADRGPGRPQKSSGSQGQPEGGGR